MIWSIRVNDVVSFTGDVYKYKVTDVQGELIILKNLLTHKYSELKISKIKKLAKIEKRND